MKPKIGKVMKRIVLLFIFANSFAHATVTAQVDRNQIVIGETFTLIIKVDKNTSYQPDLSELEQVFTVIGSSQSSSTQIINGSYSVEKSWQISLMPTGVGQNTIPPIKVGSEMTKPIRIVVTKSDPNAKANGDIFVEVEADKTTAYVKEQIILTVKLFYSIALSEGNLSEPIASSSIVTQLDKGATYTTNRNGKNYTVVERHYALFAEKSGSLDMNPIIFNGRDNSSRRSFSMFSTGKPVRAVSKPMSFEIKPIPQQSIGKDWLPATKVHLSQEWSKGPYKAGEPITRTITLYVEGLNDTQIPEIDLGAIKDVRVYPEQPQTQTEKTSQGLKAWKQVKIALIPTHEGSVRIPEFQLEWFNTKTNKTQLAKLPPITLNVDAGEFTMTKPDISQLLDKNKAEESTTAKTPKNNTNAVTEVKIIEKSSGLWKTLTALFAILWVVTGYFYIKKQPVTAPKKGNKNHKKETSKKSILNAIEAKELMQLQSHLISWWNKQYPDKQVTNLGQIKVLVNPQMAQLITQLEQQLYDKDGKSNFDQKQWSKHVNAKGLAMTQQKEQKTNIKLPELY